MAADLEAAAAFTDELRAALDKVPAHVYAGPDSARAARRAALDALKALIVGRGGHVRDRGDGAAVRLYGLRASATSGFEAACRNWITQVTLKAAAASMARVGGRAG